MKEEKLKEELTKENFSEEMLSEKKRNQENYNEEREEAGFNGENSGEGQPVLNNENADAVEVAKLKAEITEVKDRLLRAHADFDNYRKRVNKEREEWLQYSCMGLMEQLLPILDNFDLAMASLEQQSEETKKTFAGISMIIKQLKDTLQKEGLQPIESLGKEFDPVFHEAVMQVPAEEGMVENQVIEELRKGYLFKEKVLRAAMVKVVQGN